MNNNIIKYNRGLFTNILKFMVIVLTIIWLISCKKENVNPAVQQSNYKFLQVEAINQDSASIKSEIINF